MVALHSRRSWKFFQAIQELENAKNIFRERVRNVWKGIFLNLCKPISAGLKGCVSKIMVFYNDTWQLFCGLLSWALPNSTIAGNCQYFLFWYFDFPLVWIFVMSAYLEGTELLVNNNLGLRLELLATRASCEMLEGHTYGSPLVALRICHFPPLPFLPLHCSIVLNRACYC